jgi:hypothetical protein
MSTLVFQATLGGQINLNGANTASSFDIAVPATTGTMVTTGDSGTVTNTMLAASAYNTPGTIGSGTANTGAFTTLTASSTLTVTGAGSIQGLTVGRGASAVSTNTAVGASALAANTTGSANIGIGYQAGKALTTGTDSVAIGTNALITATTTGNNIGIGSGALQNTTGSFNVGIGSAALQTNSSGGNNIALGYQALISNTTASNNTAVGYQAGYTQTTAAGNAFYGYQSGYGVTTGSKNVIIGSYSGSAAPISATGSNFIVLSDGDGNVRQYGDSTGNMYIAAGNLWVYAPAPTAPSGAVTLTAAQLATDIINTTGTTYTVTLPLASAIDTAYPAAGTSMGLDFHIVNTASGTITIAVNTGITSVGTLTVATGVSAHFRLRRTAAATYILYRLS